MICHNKQNSWWKYIGTIIHCYLCSSEPLRAVAIIFWVTCVFFATLEKINWRRIMLATRVCVYALQKTPTYFFKGLRHDRPSATRGWVKPWFWNTSCSATKVPTLILWKINRTKPCKLLYCFYVTIFCIVALFLRNLKE